MIVDATLRITPALLVNAASLAGVQIGDGDVCWLVTADEADQIVAMIAMAARNAREMAAIVKARPLALGSILANPNGRA